MLYKMYIPPWSPPSALSIDRHTHYLNSYSNVGTYNEHTINIALSGLCLKAYHHNLTINTFSHHHFINSLYVSFFATRYYRQLHQDSYIVHVVFRRLLIAYSLLRRLDDLPLVVRSEDCVCIGGLIESSLFSSLDLLVSSISLC